MTKKKLYLHIGTHKAGSSALQHFLRTNETTLLKHGFLYPTTGQTNGRSDHANVVYDKVKTSQFNPQAGSIDDLLSEIAGSDAPNVIVSSEEFELLTSEDEIVAFLGRFSEVATNITIVVYFRPQFTYAASAYLQNLKQGVSEFFEPAFLNMLKWRRMNYAAFFKVWMSQPNIDFVARPLNLDMMQGGIGKDFLQVIGLEQAQKEFPTEARKNVGLSQSAAYAILYAALRAEALGKTLNRADREMLRSKFAPSGLVKDVYRPLDARLVEIAETKYQQSNERFMKACGLATWNEVFKKDIKQAQSAPQKPLGKKRLAEIERSVHDMLDGKSMAHGTGSNFLARLFGR